jgi:hypothetical protein
VIEIALVSISIGLLITSIKVTRLYKTNLTLLVMIANIMAILEIQSKINQKLVNINDLDEQFERMMRDM